MTEPTNPTASKKTLESLNGSLGFNKLVRGRDGLFLANINDLYVGRSLLAYGEYSYEESLILQRIVQPGDVALEIGANIGAHTVGLAKKAGPAGRVIAYEPQTVVFQNLCANIALNSIVNTECHQAAVGSKSGTITLPNTRYDVQGNFGGIQVGSHAQGTEVPLVTIDDTFKFDRLKLIKVDVEGMEHDVIEGARGIISKFKPFLYVENDRLDKSEALIGLIRSMEYRLWWHYAHLFNPQNFAGEKNNIYGDGGAGQEHVSLNMICAHRSVTVNIGAPEVTNDREHPLRDL